MRPSLWTVLLMFLLSLNFGQTPAEGSCKSKNSFCGIDIGKCLKEPKQNDDMTACIDLQYPKLYKNRRDATFLVTSSHDVPTSTKFGVIIVKRTTNSWRADKECCNLVLNQTCSLRPLDGEEYFLLFATDGKQFCYSHLMEHNANEIKWCYLTNEKPDCLYLASNGEVAINRTFQHASIAEYVLLKTEYCLFEAPASPSGMVRDVEGIRMTEEEGQVVRMGKESTTCKVHRRESNLAVNLKERKSAAGKTWCFFTRTEGVPWFPNATCVASVVADDRLEWKVILALLAALVVTVFSVWIYKTKIRQCFPSYKDTKGEIPKHMIGVDEEEDFLQADIMGGVKEMPDEISFAGIIRTVSETEDENGRFEQPIYKDAVACRNSVDSGCEVEAANNEKPRERGKEEKSTAIETSEGERAKDNRSSASSGDSGCGLRSSRAEKHDFAPDELSVPEYMKKIDIHA